MHELEGNAMNNSERLKLFWNDMNNWSFIQYLHHKIRHCYNLFSYIDLIEPISLLSHISYSNTSLIK